MLEHCFAFVIGGMNFDLRTVTKPLLKFFLLEEKFFLGLV